MRALNSAPGCLLVNVTTLDELDRRLLRVLLDEPRLGVLETSRRLGVARGTVQARLAKLEAAGVLTSWAPAVDPAAVGWGVTAFVTLEIAQGAGHAPVSQHLEEIPEVLEAHTITGQGDVLCRVVARSNADLQRVLDQVTSSPHVSRTSTVIALAEEIGYRAGALLSS